MASVAKWLTHRIVVPTRVGSIPISRPNEETRQLFSLFICVSPESIPQTLDLRDAQR